LVEATARGRADLGAGAAEAGIVAGPEAQVRRQRCGSCGDAFMPYPDDGWYRADGELPEICGKCRREQRQRDREKAKEKAEP